MSNRLDIGFSLEELVRGSARALESPEDRQPKLPSLRLVHTIEDIQRELAHGHIPVTDNIDALIALGFVRDRPQEPFDTMWSRVVESPDVRDGYKRQLIQRAELFTPVAAPLE